MLFETPIQYGLRPTADEKDIISMQERSYVLFKKLEPIVHVSSSVTLLLQLWVNKIMFSLYSAKMQAF